MNLRTYKKRPDNQSAIGDGTECKEEKRGDVVLDEFGTEYSSGAGQPVPENIRSKTKLFTDTPPCTLSMRPIVISVSSEQWQDVTIAGKLVGALAALTQVMVQVHEYMS